MLEEIERLLFWLDWHLSRGPCRLIDTPHALKYYTNATHHKAESTYM